MLIISAGKIMNWIGFPSAIAISTAIAIAIAIANHHRQSPSPSPSPSPHEAVEVEYNEKPVSSGCCNQDCGPAIRRPEHERNFGRLHRWWSDELIHRMIVACLEVPAPFNHSNKSQQQWEIAWYRNQIKPKPNLRQQYCLFEFPSFKASCNTMAFCWSFRKPAIVIAVAYWCSAITISFIISHHLMVPRQ